MLNVNYYNDFLDMEAAGLEWKLITSDNETVTVKGIYNEYRFLSDGSVKCYNVVLTSTGEYVRWALNEGEDASDIFGYSYEKEVVEGHYIYNVTTDSSSSDFVVKVLDKNTLECTQEGEESITLTNLDLTISRDINVVDIEY